MVKNKLVISTIAQGEFSYIIVWNEVQFIKTFNAVSWPKVQGKILASSITEVDNSSEANIKFN